MIKTIVNFTRGGGGADVNVNDHVTRFLLRDWRPPMTTYRRSALGGASYYKDVATEIPFRIIGETPEAAKENLNDIVALVDQVRLWRSGTADPVLLQYATIPSALAAPPEMLVLGVGMDREELLNLPVSFNKSIQASVIDVGLPLTLRGGMYGAAETLSQAGAANPTVRTVSFADPVLVPSPVDIAVTGFSDTTHNTVNRGILLVSNSTNGLALESTSPMENAPDDWDVVADSTFKATDNEILKYTPNGTAETSSEFLDLSTTAFDAAAQRVFVFVSLRVGGSGRSFRLRANGYNFGRLVEGSDYVFSQALYGQPTWVSLGILTMREGVREINFSASVDSLTSSPTLDIDAIALLRVDDNAYALSHEQSVALTSPFVSAGAVNLIFEQRILSEERPFVGIRELNDNKEVAVGVKEGDRAIYLTGSDVVTLWLSTRNTFWRDTHKTTDAIISIGMSATRRPVYLTPQ
jgi:hypothetical protein